MGNRWEKKNGSTMQSQDGENVRLAAEQTAAGGRAEYQAPPKIAAKQGSDSYQAPGKPGAERPTAPIARTRATTTAPIARTEMTTAPGAGGSTPEGAPRWGGGYEKEINDLFEKITGRQPFSYNINEDEMWRSLKDDYRRMGQDAMRDTMGQASGLTGGYGSSYGQAAGQAAYDKYLTQLSERAPELADRAYQRYKDEGDAQYQQLSALMSRDATAYDRFRDDYDRFLQERAYGDSRADLEYERRRSEEETDYERRRHELEYQDSRDDTEYARRRHELEYQDARDDTEYERRRREEETDYNRRRHELEYQDSRDDTEYARRRHELEYQDSRDDRDYQRRQESRSYVMSLLQYGYTPTDADLEAAGMTREEAEEMASIWGAENPDIAYRIGRISAEQYYQMTGQYPAGYTPAGSGGYGGYAGYAGGDEPAESAGGNMGDGTAAGNPRPTSDLSKQTIDETLRHLDKADRASYLSLLKEQWGILTDEQRHVLLPYLQTYGVVKLN